MLFLTPVCCSCPGSRSSLPLPVLVLPHTPPKGPKELLPSPAAERRGVASLVLGLQEGLPDPLGLRLARRTLVRGSEV